MKEDPVSKLDYREQMHWCLVEAQKCAARAEKMPSHSLYWEEQAWEWIRTAEWWRRWVR